MWSQTLERLIIRLIYGHVMVAVLGFAMLFIPNHKPQHTNPRPHHNVGDLMNYMEIRVWCLKTWHPPDVVKKHDDKKSGSVSPPRFQDAISHGQPKLSQIRKYTMKHGEHTCACLRLNLFNTCY